jgi:superfamily II DNA/RNA helicase
MQDFLSFGLPQPLLHSLDQLQFRIPTPIQAKVIPQALSGKDILGSAQTGTGKTAAFGIPLVAKLTLCTHSAALVMVPTRELAVQVMAMLRGLLGIKSPIKTALLIGGEHIAKQFQQLRTKPRLIVGTPGRINDHLIRESLKLHGTNFLVLDEADRMLDMGFTPQIDKIIALITKQRQTLLFSATLPKKVIAMSEKYLTQPVRISLGAATKPADNIKQEVLYVSEEDKPKQLLDQLSRREGSVIVFVKTKIGAEKIAKKLGQAQHSAGSIHGNLNYNQRRSAIGAFRDRKYRIMVATDVAARGLDIDHVKHVINYDVPQCPEDYIHRIGRTARAGADGSSLCFVTPADTSKWNAINFLLNPEAKQPVKRHRSAGPAKAAGAKKWRGNIGVKSGSRPPKQRYYK